LNAGSRAHGLPQVPSAAVAIPSAPVTKAGGVRTRGALPGRDAEGRRPARE
jgi:hypothetical protein